MNKQVMIVGAGNQGLAIAAYLSINNVESYLYNRTIDHINKIIETKEIVCSGIWNQKVSICDVSSAIEDVLKKIIIVTTPAYAHKDVACLLAKYVDSSYIILLSPGKTFGIIDFIHSLKLAGCSQLPIVAECQTTICVSRREGENGVKVSAIKKDIPIASIGEDELEKVLNDLPECMRQCYKKANSYIETSLGNVGMVLHPIPMLLNFGAVEGNREFKYYKEGITPTIAGLIERLDSERLEVAHKLGYDLESIVHWMRRNYGTMGNGLYEHLQGNMSYKDIVAPVSIYNRFIEEDVPYGLVPLEDIAKKLGVKVPVTTEVISFAGILMNCDYRKQGRLCNVYDISLE